MDFKIDWSPTAKFDFKDLIDFISEDKPQAALDFRDKILSHINQLKVFPKAGRKVPEFNDELIREIIEKPCRIVYRINKNRSKIEIVRIWHAARGIPLL
jgi:toxin ParE1/3/4